MVDETASSDTGATHERPDTPRWVKVFAVIAAVAIVMVVVMLLTGGNHGPGRHGSADSGGPTPALRDMQPGIVAGREPPAGHTP